MNARRDINARGLPEMLRRPTCREGQTRGKTSLFPGRKMGDGKLSTLLRQPFPAQGDVIMGLCEAFKERNSALVVGEMGSGKTLLALSVPYVLGRKGMPYRTLVMCPGHLVGKWQREAMETIPGARAVIVRKLADVMKLEKGKPKTSEYVIISKDKAKLGYAWRPAVIEKQGRYWCPQCRALVADKDGVPVSFSYLKSVLRPVSESSLAGG
jgi:hypothetical protein